MMKKFTIIIFIFLGLLSKVNSQVSLGITAVGTNLTITANFGSNYNGQSLLGYYLMLRVPDSQSGINFGSFAAGPNLPAPDIQVSNIGSNGGQTYFLLVSNASSSNTALNNWLAGSSQTLLTFSVLNSTGINYAITLVDDPFGDSFISNNYGYTPEVDSDLNIDNSPTVNGYTVPSTNIVLPIHLQSFTAKRFAANTSLLEWTTVSEENASHMEIERSMDAKSWSYVATEKARGSLNYSTDYSYVDAEAVLQRDRFTTVYYRLKLVDNDGFSEYSEVRSVTFDNNGIVSLEAYPNPSTEVINLRMAVGETNTNTAQMMMLDMTGKLVKKQTVSANGISVLEVDQLETGVYNIIVKHEDKTYQKRVIKTN